MTTYRTLPDPGTIEEFLARIRARPEPEPDPDDRRKQRLEETEDEL